MADEAVGSAEPRRWTLAGGVVGVVALAGLVGWLGYRAYEAHDADVQRDVFVQAARRTAVDLTTIDYQHAADDVQRVLDTTTGDLHQRFAASSQSLVDTVTREHAQSVSAVTAAGVESQSGDAARVLVTVSVASTHLGGTEMPPREIRMRVIVQRGEGDAKVSEVEYVQ
ncbi:MAG TPA: Mce protein [Mycobacterium sp.]|nr:Mce protein [Mycobacterium sp.]